MLRNTLIALLIGLGILSIDRANAASLVTNGGFETGDFTGWAAAGDGIAIDSVFPNTGNYDAVFGADALDLTPGTLSQTITTTPGGTYALSFALLDEAGLSGDSFTVSFGTFTTTITGDQAAPPGNLPSSENGYTGESFTVPGADIVSSSTSLIFEGLNDPESGIDWNLDDVALSCTDNCTIGPSPTPVPPALSLFATALILWLGMAYVRRRQFSV
jgi:hypothetical protein